MKISKLFLGLLILSAAYSSVNAKPMGPFGPYTRALVGLAAAAGAQLAVATNAIFDTFKTDIIRDLKNQVKDMQGVQELNTHLHKVNTDLIKNNKSKDTIITVLAATVAVGSVVLAYSNEIADYLFKTPAPSNTSSEVIEKA